MTPRSNAENDSTRQKSGAVTYLTPTKGRPRDLIAWWRCSVLVGLSGVLALAATSRVSPELQMSADASRRRGQPAAGDDWICSVGAYRALAWRQRGSSGQASRRVPARITVFGRILSRISHANCLVHAGMHPGALPSKHRFALVKTLAAPRSGTGN